jgi:hypothetical protein
MRPLTLLREAGAGLQVLPGISAGEPAAVVGPTGRSGRPWRAEHADPLLGSVGAGEPDDGDGAVRFLGAGIVMLAMPQPATETGV